MTESERVKAARRADAWDVVIAHRRLAHVMSVRLLVRGHQRSMRQWNADDLESYALEYMFRAAYRADHITRSLMAIAAHRGAIEGLRVLTRLDGRYRSGNNVITQRAMVRFYPWYPGGPVEFDRDTLMPVEDDFHDEWDWTIDRAAAEEFEHIENMELLAQLPPPAAFWVWLYLGEQLIWAARLAGITEYRAERYRAEWRRSS